MTDNIGLHTLYYRKQVGVSGGGYIQFTIEIRHFTYSLLSNHIHFTIEKGG